MVVEVGGEQAVALVGGGGIGDNVLDEVGEWGGGGAHVSTEGGAEVHGVAAGLDEAAAVGGVLDAVGEDEGFLFVGVEVVVAEEGAEGDGELGGDGAAKEADAVHAAAVGADVVGFAEGVVDEDGEDDAVLVVGVLVGFWGLGAEFVGAGVVPLEPGVGLVGVEVVFGFGAGADEGAEVGVVGEAGFAGVGAVVGFGGAVGGHDDAPAGASAAAAVEGGPPLFGVGDGAVVGPAEGGGVGDLAVDAAEFAEPEVDVDVGGGVGGAVGVGADVGEEGEEVVEVGVGFGGPGGVVAAAAGWEGEEGAGEVLEGDAAAGCGGGGVDEGIECGVGLGDGDEGVWSGGVGEVPGPGGVVGVVGVGGAGCGCAVGGAVEGVADGAGDAPGVVCAASVGGAAVSGVGGVAGGGDVGGVVTRGGGVGVEPVLDADVGVVGAVGDGVYMVGVFGVGAGAGFPIVVGEASISDEGVVVEGLGENGFREVEHGVRVVVGGEGGAGGDGGDGAQGVFGGCGGGAVAVEGVAEAAEQHGDVGALGAVVGVELVEDEVLEGVGAGGPEGGVVGAEEQLVQHFVVGEEDVWGCAAEVGAVVDEAVVGDAGVFASVFASVDAGGDGEFGVVGEDVGEAAGLVGGEGVHGVDDERFDAAGLGAFDAVDVVDDGVEEGFGFTGAGAGGDEGGLGGVVFAGEAGEGLGLVGVGWVALVPVENVCGVVLAGGVGEGEVEVGAVEDAVVGVGDEGFGGLAGFFIGEVEGGGEVFGEGMGEGGGLQAGE